MCHVCGRGVGGLHMWTAGEVEERTLATARLSTRFIGSGPEQGEPVLLVHGNASSSEFFRELAAQLGRSFRVVAPDLRGYGRSEARPIDATRGLRDFSDDLRALVEALSWAGRKVHLVGWSMGAGVAMQYAIDHPGEVASLTLESPLAPYGFGGTKDAEGTLCFADGAGSGGGTTNPEYVTRLREKDRTADSPFSPRSVMNAFYFKPPFRVAPEREDAFVEATLEMRIGDDYYPGDLVPSPNWPGVSPGRRGVNNTMAPIFCDLSGFAAIGPRPDVLWVRGADDQISSDQSLLDFGTLGQAGFVPDWPGLDVFPAQPMVSQMREVLERYRAAGGRYEEVVLEDCGHSPHIEHAARFLELLEEFIRQRS